MIEPDDLTIDAARIRNAERFGPPEKPLAEQIGELRNTLKQVQRQCEILNSLVK